MKSKVTSALITLNLIGYLWEIIVGGPGMLSPTGGGNIDRVMQEGSLYPAAVLQNGEWWRIFTGAFLHGGLIHIAVNMISLWSLASTLKLPMRHPFSKPFRSRNLAVASRNARRRCSGGSESLRSVLLISARVSSK